MPHEQPESRRREEVALLDVLDAAQPRPPLPAAARVGEAALHALGAEPLEGASASATDPSAVGTKRQLPRDGFVGPPPPRALPPLGDVGAQAPPGAVGECRGRVIALARDQRRPIRRVARVDLRRDDDLALQVDDVLRFVGEARSPVLHLGDPAVRVTRGRPVLVGDALAAPVPIHPARVLLRRVLDALRLGEPADVLAPGLAGVPAHDRLHRRVGGHSHCLFPSASPSQRHHLTSTRAAPYLNRDRSHAITERFSTGC